MSCVTLKEEGYIHTSALIVLSHNDQGVLALIVRDGPLMIWGGASGREFALSFFKEEIADLEGPVDLQPIGPTAEAGESVTHRRKESQEIFKDYQNLQKFHIRSTAGFSVTHLMYMHVGCRVSQGEDLTPYLHPSCKEIDQ